MSQKNRHARIGRRFGIVAGGWLMLSSAAGAEGGPLASRTQGVTVHDGSVVQVEAGELSVPESRKRPTARRVTIPYYRLRSESRRPAAPIFLLAGGPGASWIDNFTKNEENFREVAFYRTIADVVLFDQRGAGHSLPSMKCPQTAELTADQLDDPNARRTAMRALLTACRDQWLKEGVDLAAYNTVENAADVNDLRQALGYKKITLLGGSYGSHLALQFIRQFPSAVDRVVMFGIEGPDHTWDNPAGILAAMERVAAHAEQSPALAPHIPEGGLLKTLQRIINRLESAPQIVTLTQGTEVVRITVNADTVRGLVRGAVGRGTEWPHAILAMDRGDFSQLAQAKFASRKLGLANPMHYSMDCASSISEERRRQYRSDRATALFGNINAEYEELCDLWPSEDLGEAFHRNVVSDIPTVIFHGTFDLSTPIKNAREVAASLRRGQLVEVIGGNHGALYNLYERWPPMREHLGRFLSGKRVRFPKTVVDPREVIFRPPPPFNP